MKKYRIELKIIKRGPIGVIGVNEREVANLIIETDDDKRIREWFLKETRRVKNYE